MLGKHIGGVLEKMSSEALHLFLNEGQIRDLQPKKLLQWSMSLLAGYYKPYDLGTG